MEPEETTITIISDVEESEPAEIIITSDDVLSETAEAAEEPIETTAADYDTAMLEKLDTVIEGEQAIHSLLWLLIGIIVVGIVFKLLWTLIAKWFFGGI